MNFEQKSCYIYKNFPLYTRTAGTCTSKSFTNFVISRNIYEILFTLDMLYIAILTLKELRAKKIISFRFEFSGENSVKKFSVQISVDSQKFRIIRSLCGIVWR